MERNKKKNKKTKKPKKEYMYAYDPTIRKRVIFVVVKRKKTRYAKSLATGYEFKIRKKKRKR